MSYKIFLSYSAQEEALAEFVRNSLNHAFKNKVSFFFNDVRGGEQWKQSIQRALNEADAILTILTPKYLQKPWAYIEWAAFWLKDKTTYVIVTDDVEYKDIVDPMRDRQFTKIFNENDMIKLFDAIADEAKIAYVSYEGIAEMVNKSKAIYDKVLFGYEQSEYSIYRNETSLLPNDDFKKAKIFWYFYEKESDRNTALEVFRNINDGSIKGNMLMRLLEKNDLELIEGVYDSVESKNNLLPLLKGLVENGHENAELTDKILAYVSASQPTLRSFCEYLIKNRRVDNKALFNAIPLFTNRAELRKVGESLVDNAYVRDRVFDTVVKHFYGYNHAELQKLLKYAINSEKYSREEMREQVIILARQNQREAEKVLEDLIAKDPDLVRELIYQVKIITNPEILQRLEAGFG